MTYNILREPQLHYGRFDELIVVTKEVVKLIALDLTERHLASIPVFEDSFNTKVKLVVDNVTQCNNFTLDTVAIRDVMMHYSTILQEILRPIVVEYLPVRVDTLLTTFVEVSCNHYDLELVLMY